MKHKGSYQNFSSYFWPNNRKKRYNAAFMPPSYNLFGAVHILRLGIMHFYGNARGPVA